MNSSDWSIKEVKKKRQKKSTAITKRKHQFPSMHRSEALLDRVDIRMGDHLDKFPVLNSVEVRLVINHAFHVY